MTRPEATLTIEQHVVDAARRSVLAIPLGQLATEERQAMHPIVTAYEAAMHAAISGRSELDANRVRTGFMLAHRVIMLSEGAGQLSQEALEELRRTTGRFAVHQAFDESMRESMRQTIEHAYVDSPAVPKLLDSFSNGETRFGAMFIFGLYAGQDRRDSDIIVFRLRPETGPGSAASATGGQA